MCDVKDELRKAVIPVAGLGTRMLPFTKEQPKEMLPIYSKSNASGIAIKPIVQLIFEQYLVSELPSNVENWYFPKTKDAATPQFSCLQSSDS